MKKTNIMEDLSIIKKYADKWVAISPDEKRVLGSGETLVEAASQAKKKRVKNPIIAKIPKSGFGYIL